MAARVLIVDDEKTFRVAAQAGLAAEGMAVRTAASPSPRPASSRPT